MAKYAFDEINSFIFDMDGVITDTMQYHMNAWKRVLASHGVKVTKNDIYKREGQRGIESVKEIFHDYGQEFNHSLGERILKEKEKLFKQIVKQRFVVGSRNFLKDIKRRNLKMGLVTGTARHEVIKILPPSIYSLFDVIVCGCEVQNGKPHPEPYLTALKKLQVPSSQAVVIENAPFGIRSAKAAGIHCLAIETSLAKEFLQEADMVFSSFAQIQEYLSSIFNE